MLGYITRAASVPQENLFLNNDMGMNSHLQMILDDLLYLQLWEMRLGEISNLPKST